MRRTHSGPLGAVALLLAVVSGCGGGVAQEYTAPLTTTVDDARAGAIIRCKNGEAAAQTKVPAPGHGTGVAADGATSSASLQLTRRAGGALVVVCSP